MQRKSSSSLLLSVCLFVLACLVTACSAEDAGGTETTASQEPPPLPVQVSAAEPRSAPIEVSAVGSLRSPQSTVLSPDANGIVVELNVPEGREVARGHVFARLDPAEARAAVRVAEARLEKARLAHERARSLVEDGVVPRQNLDDAVAELSTAEGLVDEAVTSLGKTTVTAPFAGRVGIRQAQLGQRLASGDPIVQLTQIDPLELLFAVPEEDAPAVEVGQPVRGRVGRCGASFEGKVTAIDPSLDSRSRTLQVLARVPNPGRELRPGMSARVDLRVGEHEEALVIPIEALVRQGTRWIVWVLDESDAVNSRPVEPGVFFADGVEIDDGLSVGERVVVAGHQKLRPGATVAPTAWESTENPLLDLGEGLREDCD